MFLGRGAAQLHLRNQRVDGLTREAPNAPNEASRFELRLAGRDRLDVRLGEDDCSSGEGGSML